MKWLGIAVSAGGVVGLVWAILKANDRFGEISFGPRDSLLNREVCWPPIWYRRALRTYFTVERIVFELCIVAIVLVFLAVAATWLLDLPVFLADPTVWAGVALVVIVEFGYYGPRLLWRWLRPEQRAVLPLAPTEEPPPTGVPRTYRALITLLKSGSPRSESGSGE
jgi:hypothetical protein